MARFASQPEHPLHVMFKPPAPVAHLIGRMPLTSRSRGSDLLHATMLSLGDMATMKGDVFAAIRHVLSTLPAEAFRVVFDRVEADNKVRLAGSEPIRGALRFQETLRRAFRDAGLTVPRQMPRPHITLDYRWSGPAGREPIDPISWRVDDYVLIESVHGEGRHIEHGRWPLRA
jgi:2'-5' RNA ligase